MPGPGPIHHPITIEDLGMPSCVHHLVSGFSGRAAYQPRLSPRHQGATKDEGSASLVCGLTSVSLFVGCISSGR